MAVRQREEDIRVELLLAVLVDALHDRTHRVGYGLRTACIGGLEVLDDGLDQLLGLGCLVGRLVERGLDGHLADEFQTEVLVADAAVGLHEVLGIVVHDVVQVNLDTLAVECVAAARIDDLALRVHHVVVFEQALADAEVVLLDLLLGALDGTRHHAGLNHLALLQTHAVHHRGDAARAEQTHQVILERDEELRRTRVALTSRTTAQLAVHTAAFVALRTDDGQTAGSLHFGRQLDVGTAACHVGGDGHLSRTSGFGHHLCFQCVLLGVEHVVLDAAELEHAAQQLRNLDRRGADQYRTALAHEADNLLDDGIVFLALGLVDEVLAVVADDRTVRRDDHHVEFVDAPELRCLRLGRTGHTGQLVVHAEVVLQRDGGEGLRGSLDFDVLLGLDGLVQTVRIAAAVKDTARLLVDNLHLVVHHHIFDILLEHGVGLQQLDDRMDALRLDGVVVDDLVALLRLLLGRERALLEFGHLGADVGQHEETVLVEVFREHLVTLVGELHRIESLVDDEVKVVGDFGHAAVVVLHVDVLGLLHQRLDTRLRQVLDERLVLGKTLVDAVELHAALVGLALRDKLAGIGEQRGDQRALEVVEVLDGGVVLLEELVVALGYGTRDDERRTGVVDEHRVDLVDDGVVVLALHQVAGRRRHVVAQVVEAVLVVGTEGDVGHVGAAAGRRVGLRIVDAGHRKSVELIHRAHPLGVSLGQVVVYRHHVHTLAGQGVEEYRERCHEGLSLTRGHLGDFALVEHHAAEELYVVVDHVPLHVVASRLPVGGVDGLVAVDGDEVLRGGEFAVEGGGGHLDRLVLGEAPCGVLHDGEGLGEDFVELDLDFVVDALGCLVDVLRNLLLLVERNLGLLQLGLQLHDVRFVVGDVVGNLLHEPCASGAELVVRERLDGGVDSLDFLDVGFDLLAVLVGLRAEDKFD